LSGIYEGENEESEEKGTTETESKEKSQKRPSTDLLLMDDRRRFLCFQDAEEGGQSNKSTGHVGKEIA
jgi:hypothetical protein